MVDSDGYLADRPLLPPRRRDLGKAELSNLRWLSHGLTEPMIADARNVSRETVKAQLSNARSKLAAKNSTHAVAVALRLGIID